MVRVVMGDSVLSQWRAIEGTLINFSGTQILRRRRRKVFFFSFSFVKAILSSDGKHAYFRARVN